MIQLRKLPEALRAGWANFRSTLFAAPRTHTMVFHMSSPPEKKEWGPFINGDLWVNNLTMQMHYYRSMEDMWFPVMHRVDRENKK